MPASRSVTVRLEAPELEGLVREHLAELVDSVSDIRAEARGLLDFIPPEVNPIVVTRNRVEALEAAARQLLELVAAPSLLTTADVGPDELEQR